MVSNKIILKNLIPVISLITCLLLGTTLSGQAQFVRLSMQVESELRAVTLRPLTFGTVQQNSGAISVSIDEDNTGIFAITGNPAQFVVVNLEAPDTLYHADRSVDDSIPLSIEAAFANRGVERVEDARIFTDNYAFFRMFENTSGSDFNLDQPEVTAYIYIFGGIQIGDIETGVYTGDIILQVEYL